MDIKEAYQHPDRGGNEALMKELNNAWDCIRANHGTMSAEERNHIRYDIDPEILARAVRIKNLCEGIDVSVAGAWIWVLGERFLFTEDLRASLKSEGFKFSGQKKAWYWAGCKSYSRRNTPLNEIFNQYGRTSVVPERDSNRMIGGAS